MAIAAFPTGNIYGCAESAYLHRPIADMRFAATRLAGFDEMRACRPALELPDSLLARILEVPHAVLGPWSG